MKNSETTLSDNKKGKCINRILKIIYLYAALLKYELPLDCSGVRSWSLHLMSEISGPDTKHLSFFESLQLIFSKSNACMMQCLYLYCPKKQYFVYSNDEFCH